MAATDRPRLTRRRLLAGSGALAGGGLLSACGTGGTGTADPTSAGPGGVPAPTFTQADRSDSDRLLQFSNWPFYIDPAKKRDVSTLESFEQQTGITVEYSEDINDNEEFWAKVTPQLEMGQPIDRDIVVVTDDYARRFMRFAYAEPIDPQNVPNKVNLLPDLERDWDPGRRYTLPWQNGITGLGVNRRAAGREVRTFADVLAPDLAGKVSVSSEMSDTMTFFLLMRGSDPASFTDAEFQAALADFQEAFDRGQFRRVAGNDYAGDLVSGNVAVAIGYSGDVFQLTLEDPDVQFVVPEEGGGFFSDVMLIPAGAAHHLNAERLMNHYYDPEVAARLAAWVQYMTPVDGAREAMERVDPTQVDNTAIFPEATDLAAAHPFMALDDATELAYIRAYQGVIEG